MRFLLSVILVAILSAIAEYFLPWWSIALVCFVIAWFIRLSAGRSFMMGFMGVAAAWLVVSLMHDLPNDHILSTRMASLFHLPSYSLFIVVTIIVGGVVGGSAALTAALLRPKA